MVLGLRIRTEVTSHPFVCSPDPPQVFFRFYSIHFSTGILANGSVCQTYGTRGLYDILPSFTDEIPFFKVFAFVLL